jgi:RNA polymerase sigma-70 factor, ECF subfamily
MSQMSQVAHESPGTQRGQPDDAGLIAESCRAPERFGVVFDRHAAAIHGYIARRLGRDAADDLVAETFLVAFRQRGRYDPDQPSARP